MASYKKRIMLVNHHQPRHTLGWDKTQYIFYQIYGCVSFLRPKKLVRLVLSFSNKTALGSL
jgi:hypothetical protein